MSDEGPISKDELRMAIGAIGALGAFAGAPTIADANIIGIISKLADMNMDKMSDENIDKMIQEIGPKDIHLLFALKRADLLAQSGEYHGLLANIQMQEQKILSFCD